MPTPRKIGKPSYTTEAQYQSATMAPNAVELATDHVYIPANQYNIVAGYYSHRDIVSLLRAACRYPDTVRYIADMME